MRHTSTARLLLLLALAAFLLSGCGLGRWMFGKKKPERPPEVMAKEGMMNLKRINYMDPPNNG